MPLKEIICTQDQYLLFQKKLLAKEKKMESTSPNTKPPQTPSPMRRFRNALDNSRTGLSRSTNGIGKIFGGNPLGRSRNGMDRSWNGMDRSKSGMDGSRNGLDRSLAGLSPEDEGEKLSGKTPLII